VSELKWRITDAEVGFAVGGLEAVNLEAGLGAAHVLELLDVVGAGRTGERAEGHGPGDADAGVEEGVGQDLVEAGAPEGVQVEDLGDEAARGVGDGHVVREGVAVDADLLVGGLDVRRLEGRLADEQRVDDDAERPDVDFVAVARLALQDLGRDVVGRAADGLLLLALELDLGGQAEVAQLDLHLLAEEEVAQLEVAVDHLVLHQVLHRVQDLQQVALHLDFRQPLAPLEQLVQRLVLAHLQQDVHVLVVLEHVFEVHHVRVVQTLVDLYFRNQLLPRPVLP